MDIDVVPVTIQLSCSTFWGFRYKRGISVGDIFEGRVTLKDIADHARDELIAYLSRANLVELVKVARSKHFHIHSFRLENILSSVDEGVCIYVCTTDAACGGCPLGVDVDEVNIL